MTTLIEDLEECAKVVFVPREKKVTLHVFGLLARLVSVSKGEIQHSNVDVSPLCP